MPVKLFKTDATREQGWDYYFDDGRSSYWVPLADDGMWGQRPGCFPCPRPLTRC